MCARSFVRVRVEFRVYACSFVSECVCASLCEHKCTCFYVCMTVCFFCFLFIQDQANRVAGNQHTCTSNACTFIHAPHLTNVAQAQTGGSLWWAWGPQDARRQLMREEQEGGEGEEGVQ